MIFRAAGSLLSCKTLARLPRSPFQVVNVKYTTLLGEETKSTCSSMTADMLEKLKVERRHVWSSAHSAP